MIATIRGRSSSHTLAKDYGLPPMYINIDSLLQESRINSLSPDMQIKLKKDITRYLSCASKRQTENRYKDVS